MALALGRRDRPLLHLALLALTLVSTTLVYRVGFPEPVGPWGSLSHALTFSVSLLLILGCHEMGHYLFARCHGVDSSLPYFIPVPFGMGTLGAVIRIRSRIPTRNALVDIGAAGPLAGVVVALPVLVVGLLHSRVQAFAVPAPVQLGGPESLWGAGRELAAWAWAHLHQRPFTSAEGPEGLLFGDSLLLLGLERLLVGPLGAGQQVVAHPMVTAGWFGLLVTMLNLLPIGQLDGGHVAYAVFGERARWVGRATAAVLLGLTLFVSWSWLVWMLLTTFVIGVRHPPVELPGEPLTRGRRHVALLCLVLLVLCFMPVPLRAS